jgi:hypothetical protein
MSCHVRGSFSFPRYVCRVTGDDEARHVAAPLRPKSNACVPNFAAAGAGVGWMKGWWGKVVDSLRWVGGVVWREREGVHCWGWIDGGIGTWDVIGVVDDNVKGN